METETGKSARALVHAWSRAQKELEDQHLRELRALTERESARIFARLLSVSATIPLRPSSGLVEQQRILARLRESE